MTPQPIIYFLRYNFFTFIALLMIGVVNSCTGKPFYRDPDHLLGSSIGLGVGAVICIGLAAIPYLLALWVVRRRSRLARWLIYLVEAFFCLALVGSLIGGKAHWQGGLRRSHPQRLDWHIALFSLPSGGESVAGEQPRLLTTPRAPSRSPRAARTGSAAVSPQRRVRSPVSGRVAKASPRPGGPC